MTDPRRKPAAPGHLRAPTKRWWLMVVNTWSLEEHHVRLLTLCAESWDRYEQARELIRRQGLTVETKEGGVRAHPAVRIESEARIAFARLLRELDLDIAAPAEAKRPPALRSVAR